MSRRRRCSWLLASALLPSALPRPALAYLPFDGTDADVAEHGEIELEVSPLGYAREGKESSLTAPALVFNYGILPRWELVLEAGHSIALGDTRDAARSSLDDPAISAKALWLAGSLQGQSRAPSFATELSALLPAGHDDPGVGVELAGILSECWSNLTLHLNLAGELTRAHQFAPFASLIVEGPGRWRVRPVGELLISHDFAARDLGAETTSSALLGLIYAARENLALDVASRVAVNDASQHEFELRAGFTWAIEP